MTCYAPSISLAAFLERLGNGQKVITVTELRRHSLSAFDWIEELGNTVLITKHQKPDCVLMSTETYAYLTGDYAGTMRALREAVANHTGLSNPKSEDYE